MADNTKIEWADATLNYVNGCSVLSPGCTNCYAMKQAHRFPVRQGLTTKTKGGMVWTGEVRANERALQQALAWKRGRKIFWNAHGDLFHDSVPDEWIDRLFAVCALTPQHTHMILTKRSARMREYFADEDTVERVGTERWRIAGPLPALERFWPLPNVWLGVSVEDQKRADERIPDLLATPAALRFISAEPLLGPVDLEEWLICPNARDGLIMDTSTGAYECCRSCDWTGLIGGIGWVIVGGESGPRPMHPDWARSLRDQCAAACVPYMFKQWGDWEASLDRERDDPDWRADYTNNYVHRGKSRWLNLEGGCGFHGERFHVMRRVGKKHAGRLLDGIEHNGFPEVAR